MFDGSNEVIETVGNIHQHSHSESKSLYIIVHSVRVEAAGIAGQ